MPPPAVGLRVDYVASPTLTLSYDDFFGDVAPDGVAAQYRLYHDFIAQLTLGSNWQIAGMFSLGTQTRSTADAETATWYGFTVLAKYKVAPRVSIVARLERYSDPHQVIVTTGLPDAFRTNGASLGIDVTPVPKLPWMKTDLIFRTPLGFSPDFLRGDHADSQIQENLMLDALFLLLTAALLAATLWYVKRCDTL